MRKTMLSMTLVVILSLTLITPVFASINIVGTRGLVEYVLSDMVLMAQQTTDADYFVVFYQSDNVTPERIVSSDSPIKLDMLSTGTHIEVVDGYKIYDWRPEGNYNFGGVAVDLHCAYTTGNTTFTGNVQITTNDFEGYISANHEVLDTYGNKVFSLLTIPTAYLYEDVQGGAYVIGIEDVEDIDSVGYNVFQDGVLLNKFAWDTKPFIWGVGSYGWNGTGEYTIDIDFQMNDGSIIEQTLVTTGKVYEKTTVYPNFTYRIDSSDSIGLKCDVPGNYVVAITPFDWWGSDIIETFNDFIPIVSQYEEVPVNLGSTVYSYIPITADRFMYVDILSADKTIHHTRITVDSQKKDTPYTQSSNEPIVQIEEVLPTFTYTRDTTTGIYYKTNDGEPVVTMPDIFNVVDDVDLTISEEPYYKESIEIVRQLNQTSEEGFELFAYIFDRLQTVYIFQVIYGNIAVIFSVATLMILLGWVRR